MHVGIVAQRENPHAAELADEMRRALECRVSIDESTADALGRAGSEIPELAACDLVVSIGGDGTFLLAAREVTPTPVMGVNLGEVGFLNVVPPEEAVDTVRQVIERFRAGDRDCQELPQVQASGDGWTLPPAVNEVSILGPQRGRGYGIGVEARVDGQLYSGTHADGLLVATPAGSTAYNLSEGGPLVHPDVPALVLTEMCADGPMPSLALPLDAEISVRIDAAEHAYVVADGRTRERVCPPTNVTLELAADPVRIAGPPLEFFTALGKLE